MKKLLAVPLVAVLAFLVAHAVHVWQMIYWLWYGEWTLAFYSSYCTQDALSNFVFGRGGMLWILGFFIPILLIYFVRKFVRSP